MGRVKYLLLMLFAVLLISCGKDDENESDNTGENNEQTTEQKTTDDKLQVSDSTGKTSEQPKTKTDKEKSSEELKFYSNSKPEAVISPLQAKDYIGRVVAVQGFVADVYKTEKVAYLNFVEKFPDNPFSGVIFANRFKDFNDLNIYAKKNVELTGRVTVYKGKPQIIMDSEEQVKILN